VALLPRPFFVTQVAGHGFPLDPQPSHASPLDPQPNMGLHTHGLAMISPIWLLVTMASKQKKQKKKTKTKQKNKNKTKNKGIIVFSCI
jgi:hypothetical protein